MKPVACYAAVAQFGWAISWRHPHQRTNPARSDLRPTLRPHVGANVHTPTTLIGVLTYQAALLCGWDGKGANARHGIQHHILWAEQAHQPLVLPLQPRVPVHLREENFKRWATIDVPGA